MLKAKHRTLKNPQDLYYLSIDRSIPTTYYKFQLKTKLSVFSVLLYGSIFEKSNAKQEFKWQRKGLNAGSFVKFHLKHRCSCHWHFPALKKLEGLALVHGQSGMKVPHGTYGTLEGDISETVGIACPVQCETWFCFILPWLVRGKFSAWTYRADADDMQVVEKKCWCWGPSSLSYLLLFDKAELTDPKEKKCEANLFKEKSHFSLSSNTKNLLVLLSRDLTLHSHWHHAGVWLFPKESECETRMIGPSTLLRQGSCPRQEGDHSSPSLGQ